MMILERLVQFIPAYDKRSPDRGEDGGICGVKIVFVVKGAAGAVSWYIITPWDLPHVEEELARAGSNRSPRRPTLGPITTHSLAQRRLDQESGECGYVEGGTCYADNAFLAGDDAYKALVEDGDEGLWKLLGSYYEREFYGDD